MYLVCHRWLIGLMAVLMVDPLYAAKPETPTVGEIAAKLMIGTDVVTKLFLVACLVIGALLVITAITHFRNHYLNPKFVPLDRPIIYLILGLALFSIPFLGEIFLPTSSTIDVKKREAEKAAAAVCPVDVDAPLEMGNEFNH